MTSGPDGIRAGVDVTIRYWASARAVAGCDSDCFPGRHVGDVLDAAAAAHAGLAAVLKVSTILLDGRPVTASALLPGSLPGSLPGESRGPSSEGTVLEVLPPFAGG